MNIYNNFRGVGQLANRYALEKRFDEPTYFTFRLVFANGGDSMYNKANITNDYDTMPHPLFNPNVSSVGNIPSNAAYVPVEITTNYSAIKYLEDANEPTRVEMLKEFIEKFNYLQTNYQYYFQSIENVPDLLKVDPTKGQRILNNKKIIISCLEAVDLRMTYLMNLYKKIVWDDVYQRWVLPDMMRYFSLDIYLTEFRTFHTVEGKNGYGFSTDKVPAVNSPVSTPVINQLIPLKNNVKTNIIQNPPATSEPPTFLNILDDILPTWKITCEMCEFDITDVTYEHLNNLNVADMPAEGKVKFGIKIGNIKELQAYPVFKHMFLSDKALNSLKRAQDEISTDEKLVTNRYAYPAVLQIGQNRETELNNSHVSGTPFIERTNQNTVDDTKGAVTQPRDFSRATNMGLEGKLLLPSGAVRESERSEPLLFYNDRSGAAETPPFSPTLPDTWVGNAVNFGMSFAKNAIKSVVDKAKVTSIPKLGVSFSEIQAALQSKNIITAFGLIKKGINQITQQDSAPSSRLAELQSDQLMREFLIQIRDMTKSDATDKEHQELARAANLALNDNGTWEAIKDFSKATNMVGPGEVNSPNVLKPATYPQPSDKSMATNMVGVNSTGATEINIPNPISSNTLPYVQPTDKSMATNMVGPGEVNVATPLDTNGTISVPIASKATQSTLEIGGIIESAPSSSRATTSTLQL